ncbi:unnamed protein product [Enterobius vermicularis]|uniref:SERPIN domain-containing protein n=1 Tax=Enterobius vermicularis TaxID=51028 RepID=A0A0N4V2B5_ENTVE|nr:unnamed protein product [Enterobius vermicularis]
MEVAQADYTLGLLREAAGFSETMVLSPFSITSAFAVACLGADGNTKKEIHDLFAKGCSEDEFHSYVSQNVKDIANGSETYTLSTANRLFHDRAFKIEEDYLKTVGTKYFGQLEPADFSNSEKTAAVEMMHKIDSFDYYSDDSVQVLGIPYEGNEVKMLIFLPVEKFGLTKFLTNIDGKKLLQYMMRTSRTKVEVGMPKFCLEIQFELSGVLGRMGLSEAFSDSANFRKMSAQSLFISTVLHKAFIEVNEEGTEAAAATAIAVSTTSLHFERPTPTFTADHPFMFVIAKGNTLLFAGKYY